MNMLTLARSVARKDSSWNSTFMQAWFCSYFIWTSVAFLRTVKVFRRTQAYTRQKFHNGDLGFMLSSCQGTEGEANSNFYTSTQVELAP